MEASTSFDGPRFPKRIPQIRKALKIEDDTPVQRKTDMPEPLCSRQTDLFFGVTTYDDETGKEVPERPYDRFKRELTCVQICAVCPYRVWCLAKGIVHSQYDDMYGVYGGYTVKGRRRLRAWLFKQKTGQLVLNEELIWNIQLYEARKTENQNILSFLREQCNRV